MLNTLKTLKGSFNEENLILKDSNSFYDYYQLKKSVLIQEKSTNKILLCTHIHKSLHFNYDLLCVLCNNAFYTVKYKKDQYNII